MFSAIDLETGQPKIIKTVFYEDFHVRVGFFRIRCYRSPKKEARVLDLVRGDTRFMQGITLPDDKNNSVRIMDFIKGKTFLEQIQVNRKPHEQYFAEDLPQILWNLKDCIEAILFLHHRSLQILGKDEQSNDEDYRPPQSTLHDVCGKRESEKCTDNGTARGNQGYRHGKAQIGEVSLE